MELILHSAFSCIFAQHLKKKGNSMNKGKILIVFFSRTGTTRRVAEGIHRKIGGEFIEVTTRHYPRGFKGYFRAGFDAALGRAVPIQSKSPSVPSYDWIIVGTPVWDASVSAPIRTYLSQSLPHTKHFAFFLTHGGSGAQRVFQQMESLCGKRPVATLDVTIAEVHRKKYNEKLENFISKLKSGKRKLALVA
jgi:flavodoxin